MIQSFLPKALSTLLPSVERTIDRVVVDRNAAMELKGEISKLFVETSGKTDQLHAELIKADQQSESFLTRNIRPLTVLWAIGLVTAEAMGLLALRDELAPKLFDIAMYGSMIYFGSRGVEKVVKTASENPSILGAFRRG